MAIYRPDIKPPMWGPPDAVQFAVRANAERMGVDPDSLILNLPFWEGAGTTVTNISTGRKFHIGNTSVLNSRGVVFNGSSFLDISAETRLGFLQNKSDAYSIIIPGLHGNSQDNRRFFTFGTSGSGFMGLGTDFNSPNRKFLCFQSANFSGTWTFFSNDDFFGVGPINFACTFVKSEYFSLYKDGTRDSYIYRTGGTTTEDTPFICIGAAIRGSTPAGFSFFIGSMQSVLVFDGLLTPSQIATLHHTPYALLMPVARPVFFDLGAGQGVAKPTNLAGAATLNTITWTWTAG